MLLKERPAAYALHGTTAERAASLDDAVLEEEVEEQWFSCKIDRKLMKALMKRSDWPAIGNFGLWIALLLGSGVAGFLTWGTWWAAPAFFVYGTVYSSSDARWHECGHGTAFRTRWLNEVFYHVSSFMTLREAYLWRWSHSRHHTDTIIVGRDPEIQVSRPADLVKIALDFFNVFGGTGEMLKIFSHAFGRISPEIANFIPLAERKKVVWSSRVYVTIFGAAAALALDTWSFLPLMYIWLPRFYCGWHHQLCGLTQHAGLAENVRDHRLNTRTVYMNSVYRFLYLNMNYHIEHHMFPMVPYHALPKLHEAVKDQMPRPYTSLIDAYGEIIPALLRQARDPGYFVRRTAPGEAAADTFAATPSAA